MNEKDQPAGSPNAGAELDIERNIILVDESIPSTHEPVKFDWLLYADATFAGLSVLIPLPIIDGIFEGFFRRRMPHAIAKRRGVTLDQETLRVFQSDGCSPAGCLIWPFKQAFNLLKKISRKILYFLTIKEATDMVSYYWHRAYLFDHILRADMLTDSRAVVVARRALDETLKDTTTGPVYQLAQQIVGNSHHVFRSLWRIIRRKKEDDDIQDHKSVMGKRWSDYDDYWSKLTDRYEQRFAFLQQEMAQQIARREAAAREAAQRNNS